jgi:hypothetical protein
LDERLTVADLVFGNFAFFFDVEAAHEEVPFALEACWGCNAYFCRWWRRKAFYTAHADNFFLDLFHLDSGNLSGNVAVVVKRTLDLVEEL